LHHVEKIAAGDIDSKAKEIEEETEQTGVRRTNS